MDVGEEVRGWPKNTTFILINVFSIYLVTQSLEMYTFQPSYKEKFGLLNIKLALSYPVLMFTLLGYNRKILYDLFIINLHSRSL